MLVISKGRQRVALSGSGSSLIDPILISSAAEWATLSSKINNCDYENSYHYVRLTSDIPNQSEKAAGKTAVTNMVGDHVSTWIFFDGNDHTITVNINNVIKGTAPFARVDNSRFENLTIDGSVTSTEHHAAGLIGICEGTAIIQNCHISADVNSPTYAGGIVGHGGNLGHKLIMNKSYYDGTISGFNNYAGGLMGWCDDVELLIADCLFKGSFQPGRTGQYHPIACKHAPSVIRSTHTEMPYAELRAVTLQSLHLLATHRILNTVLVIGRGVMVRHGEYFLRAAHPQFLVPQGIESLGSGHLMAVQTVYVKLRRTVGDYLHHVRIPYLVKQRASHHFFLNLFIQSI